MDKEWKDSNKRTNSGGWDWISPNHLWKGHQGSYAEWIKNHPECDTSKDDYDPNLDTCLKEE